TSATYSSVPPTSAAKLMSKGTVKPCQIWRLYSGVAVPSTERTATSRNGPAVAAGKIPTSRHAATRNTTGATIHDGTSGGWRGRSVGGGPKSAPWMKRSEYTTLKLAASVAT